MIGPALAVNLAVLILCTLPVALMSGTTPAGISLASASNPSVYGRPVTLTAVVAPPTATGSVTFYDGTTVLGTSPLASGTAGLSTIFLPSGKRSLRAYYGGDATYAPSSSAALAQVVNAVPGGVFAPALTYPAGKFPAAVVVGDLNGDGLADLAVTNTGTNISVLFGNGNGSFKPPATMSVGATPSSLAIGDFNGDGRTDLAVDASLSGYFEMLLGNGDGTFRTISSAASGSAPVVADFNADGKADLAAVNFYGNNVSVRLGNGDGTFQDALTYATGNSPVAVSAGEFNGDGRADLAVVNVAGKSVSVLLGNGDGTFKAAVNYSAGNEPRSVVTGDFNGDGKADLAIADHFGNSVGILQGNGDGTFQALRSYPVGTGPYSVITGDFNGDGNADLATANQGGTASVLMGKGDGTFQTANSYSVSGTPLSIAAADFNGDGRPDLVVANSSSTNSVSVLLNAIPVPDLTLTMADSGPAFVAPPPNLGGIAAVVRNVGSGPTTGETVTVTISLPGVKVDSIIATGWTCVLATLTCTRGDRLAVGAGYPAISVYFPLGADDPSLVTMTATVRGGGETNTANDTASDSVAVFRVEQAFQWSALPKPPAALTAALLLTDGTVMAHQGYSPFWYRLTPDKSGNYLNGTWSQAASLPPGYTPFAYSSAVLADGRLAVIGGEYNNGLGETNLGAIYDPIANAWTPLTPPTGWDEIGDSSNAVLPSGQLLQASLDTRVSMLDPSTLTWTNLKSNGKRDQSSEEGWTLLPDGSVLTIDSSGTQTERYIPQTDTWVSAGNTVSQLFDDNYEIGPQVLRPNGTVLAVGATGHTGVYNVATGTWAAGPDLPVSNGLQVTSADVPGVLLPNGNVLFTGTTTTTTPTSIATKFFLFEFDGSGLNPVVSARCFSMIPLPTGQILCVGSDTLGPAVGVYTPAGSPDPAWAPAIAKAPGAVQPGQTYSVSGTQFNGLSQAVGFGDDYQGATNYPLVRITNTATGHVFYCRTHHHSTMGVATGATPVSTSFDVPASIETGPSTLVVVVNGIASRPVSLIVAATASVAAPFVKGVAGGALSVPAVTAISANGYFSVFGTNLAPPGTSRQLAASDIVSGSLPTNLASTCVYVGPASAFPTYVSPGQVNAIAPALPSTSSAAVSVVTNCGTPTQTVSPAVNVAVAPASPEFLYWVQNADGQDAVIAVDALRGDYIGPAGVIPGLTFRPARAGDILTIYGIGFGVTGSGPMPGSIPSSADTVPPGFSVLIGGRPAPVSYVGVTPGAAGLYQVNVTVPAGLPAGNAPIVLTVNGATAPPRAFLAVVL